MAQLTNQDDFIKTALRLPRGVHAKTQDAATKAGRSMNAEIVHRLERSFSQPEISDGLIVTVGVMAMALKQFAASLDSSQIPAEKQKFIELLEQAATQVIEKIPETADKNQ